MPGFLPYRPIVPVDGRHDIFIKLEPYHACMHIDRLLAIFHFFGAHCTQEGFILMFRINTLYQCVPFRKVSQMSYSITLAAKLSPNRRYHRQSHREPLIGSNCVFEAHAPIDITRDKTPLETKHSTMLRRFDNTPSILGTVRIRMNNETCGPNVMAKDSRQRFPIRRKVFTEDLMGTLFSIEEC